MFCLKDANDEKQEGVKMLKTHPSSLVDPKLPTLPVYCGCGYASSEGTSDTESEFFPDWSSADSAASDRCQDDIRLGESSDQFLWPDHIGVSACIKYCQNYCRCRVATIGILSSALQKICNGGKDFMKVLQGLRDLWTYF